MLHLWEVLHKLTPVIAHAVLLLHTNLVELNMILMGLFGTAYCLKRISLTLLIHCGAVTMCTGILPNVFTSLETPLTLSYPATPHPAANWSLLLRKLSLLLQFPWETSSCSCVVGMMTFVESGSCFWLVREGFHCQGQGGITDL